MASFSGCEGLQILVKSVFHLLLVECEVTPEESWVKEESRHLIKKFEVRDMSNKLLGTIYMDMFKREGKVTNVMAAAQVIRLRKNRHFNIGTCDPFYHNKSSNVAANFHLILLAKMFF